jgi:hypothetical protein
MLGSLPVMLGSLPVMLGSLPVMLGSLPVMLGSLPMIYLGAGGATTFLVIKTGICFTFFCHFFCQLRELL